MATTVGALAGMARGRLLRWTLPVVAVAAVAALPGTFPLDPLPVARAERAEEASGGRQSGDYLQLLDEARASQGGSGSESDGWPGKDYEVVPATSAPSSGSSSDSPVASALAASGIPEVALRAYMAAQQTMAVNDPGCGVRWSLLAAVGRIESNHGRYGGAELREDGTGTKPIRGIPLDGRPGVTTIRDTDGGALDGDAVFDRAVGPMQFIPSSWRFAGADGDGDGRRDPDNIFDAALAAAGYLCAGDGNLSDPAQRAEAVFRYNRSQEYVRLVLALADEYERGGAPTVPTSSVQEPPPVLPEEIPPASESPDPGLEPVPGLPPPTSPTTGTTTSSSTSTSTSSSTSTTTTTQCPTTTTTLPDPTSTTTTSTSTTTTTVPPGCPTTTTTAPPPPPAPTASTSTTAP